MNTAPDNSHGKSQHILLIEDDENTRELYKEVLETAGFRVIPAVDGQEGLDKARVGGYACMLLDMIMPKLNGMDVLATLKKEGLQGQNGPIIILTNLARDMIIKDALIAGANECFIKTNITPDQLITEVKQAILRYSPS